MNSNIPEPRSEWSDPAAAAVKVRFPAWHILRSTFGNWCAQWKSPSGLSIHVVYGTDLDDLARRLDVVEAARADSEAGS